MTDCFHCGEPVPAGVLIQSTLNEKNIDFCCYGCQAITEFIHNQDLQHYYQRRTALAQTADTEENHTLLLLEDSDIYPLYVYQEGNHHHIQLAIDGMTCAACAWLIEKYTGDLTGVESLHVNLNNSIAALVWQPEQISLVEIANAVSRIGYKITPYREDLSHTRMRREKQQSIIRLGIAGVGMMQVMMSAIALYAGDMQGMDDSLRNLLRWSSFCFSVPVIGYSALPFFKAALRDLRTGHFTMDLPVTIGLVLAFSSSVIALFSSSGQVYFDSVTMFTFFLLLGRFLEQMARQRNREKHSSHELNSVTRIDAAGQAQIYPKSKVVVDDILQIAPGEEIPVDGVIVKGESEVDESSLTGEYMPVFYRTGNTVHAATTNITQTIQIRVTAAGAQTRMAAIARLTQRALAEKPAIVRLTDKVAHYFVIAILLTAGLTYLGWVLVAPTEAYWIMVSVLVVTCPCALSLATPTALTAATYSICRLGLLITRGHMIESLSQCRHLVFDKTGTLTSGKFTIITVTGDRKTHCLKLCAALEADSIHPVATAFGQYQGGYQADRIVNVTGRGVEGTIEGIRYRLGNRQFIAEWHTEILTEEETVATQTLYLSDKHRLLCRLTLKDTLKSRVTDTLQQLKQKGLKLSLLTGDTLSATQATLDTRLFDNVMAGQTPEQKCLWLASQQDREQLLMIGDGLNDVPSLAGTTTSITMEKSSDLAKKHADGILLNNDVATLLPALQAVHHCNRIIKQNLLWAIAYNSMMLPLAIAGLIPPWLAAIGMAGSSLIVVLNSTRLSKIKIT